MSSNLAKKAENLDLFRHVTVTMFFAREASQKRKEETGKDHSNLIHENFVLIPPVVDTLDITDISLFRKLWLQSIERQPDQDKLIAQQETTEDIFVRLLEQAGANHSKTMMMSFVAAARYPVPSEYSIRLPDMESSLRKEIIGTLIPFIETRKRMLRLEDKLDLPMRSINIGHTAIGAVDTLQATIN